jgi:hypothetical protein
MAMIDRNFTFATNGTVSAADLHNLIDSATIYQDIITGQVPITSVGTNYELLIADGTNPNAAPNAVTVYDLFDDALTAGTYTNANISAALTYGTATGTRLVSANATITTGTITTGVIPTLTSSTATFGTTTSTAATITSGTITNLASTTGTIATLNSTNGTIATINSTTGTIGNLSTTLAGDFTISQGTATLSTTGATAATYGTTSAIPVLTVDAKGRTTSATSVTNPVGFRNRIINGDMRIDQRNAGASQTFTAAAVLAYSVDRFYGYCTGANVTGARVAGTAPNEFVYQFTGAASVTGIGFGTRLEATNIIDLAGSTATLSVQLANSLLTTVTWTAFYATTVDAFGSNLSPTRTQIATGTFTVTSALTTYSAQISVPSAATTGIEILFTVGAQTSGTWTIDNVQLEAGSTATDFERRPIGTELALCQRYYLKTKPTLNNRYGNGRATSTTQALIVTHFPVQMRTPPVALEGSGTGSHYGIAYLATSVTCNAVPTFNSATEILGQSNFTATAALTAGQAIDGYNANASGFLAWGVEL